MHAINDEMRDGGPSLLAPTAPPAAEVLTTSESASAMLDTDPLEVDDEAPEYAFPPAVS